MADLRFKPKDPLNPYDPASLSLGEQGVLDRIKAGQSPLNDPTIQAMLNDPAQRETLMAAVTQIMKEDADERERTGESEIEQIKREKAEWAAKDARSAALKVQGNTTFTRYNYKQTFVIYSVCALLSPHEPLYILNQAAAALKLKAFVQAEQDADLALRFKMAKAYFRQAQARRYLRKFDGATEDLLQAQKLQAGDPSIKAELDEVQRLKGLPLAKLRSWVTAQGTASLQNIFGSIKAMEAQIEEIKDGET